MRIAWLGHSAFLIETKDKIKIITDPYEPGGYSGAVRYSPINVQPDIVTVSHKHPDHSYVRGFNHAIILDKEGSFQEKHIKFRGIKSYHDEKQGALRGENIIFIIEAEGLKIVHFGDLGTTDIDCSYFRNIDVAFLPVGGVFTIDSKEASAFIEKISPKITVPMHFKTPKLEFDIACVDDFLVGKKDKEEQNYLNVVPENINFYKKIVTLKYHR